MLKYERIRRFAYLKELIVKWTNEENLELLIKLLKETEGEGDVIERVKSSLFNDICAIKLIRYYLDKEVTENIDHEWLTEEEIESCNKKAYSIYQERLDSEEWGIL